MGRDKRKKMHVCEGLRKYGKKKESKEINVHTCTHTPSIYTVTEPNHRRWWELLSWLFPGRPPRQPVSITHVYNSAMQRYVHRNPCSKLTHTQSKAMIPVTFPRGADTNASTHERRVTWSHVKAQHSKHTQILFLSHPCLPQKHSKDGISGVMVHF